ncbi:MAG: hypothetical protein OEN23_12965 [Paracoccaceae bacterium]|nr:hypothetical protein [Paracoccaceae bacterium]
MTIDQARMHQLRRGIDHICALWRCQVWRADFADHTILDQDISMRCAPRFKIE